MNLAALPFCYSRPSTYDDDAPGCLSCRVRTSCRANAQVVLGKVALRVDVSDLQARFLKDVHRDAVQQSESAPIPNGLTEDVGSSIQRSYAQERVTYSLTERDQAMLAQLPKKVANKARVLMEKGIDFLASKALARGENPFAEKGDRPLHVAAELLLAGGFTRERLRTELQRRYDWTYHAAASHVSQVVALLTAFGVAREVTGKLLVLTPPSDVPEDGQISGTNPQHTSLS
ncbi:hypothetical protein [Cupriavidus metallidurans]|uniref:hypothetical protein n=1 Tax=Cupriavidus metallidurans TaxID=119219 RepID=UPI001CCB0763|nr:hypothetical protein [Cupriavidus metallidurans]UBM12723.1 hypothetical protein LAI70_28330 [Cupriavidus metallidurans]